MSEYEYQKKWIEVVCACGCGDILGLVKREDYVEKGRGYSKIYGFSCAQVDDISEEKERIKTEEIIWRKKQARKAIEGIDETLLRKIYIDLYVEVVNGDQPQAKQDIAREIITSAIKSTRTDYFFLVAAEMIALRPDYFEHLAKMNDLTKYSDKVNLALNEPMPDLIEESDVK